MWGGGGGGRKGVGKEGSGMFSLHLEVELFSQWLNSDALMLNICNNYGLNRLVFSPVLCLFRQKAKENKQNKNKIKY